jgi:hypothetical protein|tara:strand:- start:6560 stop:6772 length:213 start_codon:yes stop_codon:yes gene_type:complete
MSCKNCTCDKDKCQKIVSINGKLKECDCETCICKFQKENKDDRVKRSNEEIKISENFYNENPHKDGRGQD